MEKNNQASSSFTNDLFGSTDSYPNSAANGIFSSIFAAPSAVAERNHSTSESNANEHKLQLGYTEVRGDVIKGKEDESNCISSKEMNSIFQERSGPSPLSSSLYYGAKEDMYVNSPGPLTSGPNTDYKKDGGVNDPSGNNSTGASRGNWWQGSLYY
ncbi:hypothetical protein SASPL_101101 [Salvia splendens]|uniref:Uncharacterized protein n=1 Tax=Salvia splendens TaxID=180675 RepID=A0A8X8YTY9_SALSN|nr:uncharacterized protein LOC121742060 [Salvia splendens]KAG6436216.1 hypothetical protein SASPL_101101 [Salvia splendens]